jgi:hypothetical protein
MSLQASDENARLLYMHLQLIVQSRLLEISRPNTHLKQAIDLRERPAFRLRVVPPDPNAAQTKQRAVDEPHFSSHIPLIRVNKERQANSRDSAHDAGCNGCQ